MDKRAKANIEALQAALDIASTPKATKRLMIALAYADDVPVDTLSDRYDIPRATIYSWFNRFEDGTIAEAIMDKPRPGRPSKLDDSQQERLTADLAESPTKHGYDGSEWSPKLVRSHIKRTCGVTYSLGHARRLLQWSRSAH